MYHERAVKLAGELRANKSRLITTRAVLLEIGNALSKQRYRAAAVRLLIALESDPTVEIIPLAEQLYIRALQLYRERDDKDWGLTDCISFVVMGDEGITDALTTDIHFRQAGFTALLLEN
jgi:predicted nucleic acid-binding protein